MRFHGIPVSRCRLLYPFVSSYFRWWMPGDCSGKASALLMIKPSQPVIFFSASNEISILQRWNQIPHVLIMFKGVNVSQCNSLNPLWHTAAGCWGSRRSQAGWSQDLQDRCEAGGADRPSVPELPGWPWEWSNVGFDKSDKYVKRPTRKDKTNQKAGWWWWWEFLGVKVFVSLMIYLWSLDVPHVRIVIPIVNTLLCRSEPSVSCQGTTLQRIRRARSVAWLRWFCFWRWDLPWLM